MTDTHIFRNIFTATLIAAFTLAPFARGSAEILWEEQPQFHVEMNGTIDVSGRVFRPTDNRPLLIFISDGAKSPLLIDLSKKTVQELSLKSLTVRDEYSYVTTKVPKGKKVGSYKIAAGASVFSYKGKKYSIRVKESLVGEVSENVVLSHSPEYAIIRDAYRPKAAHVNAIKKYDKPIDVVVMFATWCPTCKQILPKLMSILDAAGNKNISVRYIGIAMGGSAPQDALEKYGHDYPACIFFRDGKEIDRIIGEPHVSLEQSIAEILSRR